MTCGVRLNCLLFLLACVAALAAVPSKGEEGRIDAALHQLEQVRTVSDVSISPDGRWVTWSQRDGGAAGTEVVFMQDRTSSQAQPKRVKVPEAGDGEEVHGVSWSPDSRRIAFLVGSGSSQQQVYLMTADSGETQKTD